MVLEAIRIENMYSRRKMSMIFLNNRRYGKFVRNEKTEPRCFELKQSYRHVVFDKSPLLQCCILVIRFKMSRRRPLIGFRKKKKRHCIDFASIIVLELDLRRMKLFCEVDSVFWNVRRDRYYSKNFRRKQGRRAAVSHGDVLIEFWEGSFE